jgi:hypothetical protein
LCQASALECDPNRDGRNLGPNRDGRRRATILVRVLVRPLVRVVVAVMAVAVMVAEATDKKETTMFRIVLAVVTFLSDFVFLFQTLVPLCRRNWYWDAQHQLHFAVWWEWFGMHFATDDVVVKYDAEMERRCIEAYERGEYKTLEDVIAELREKCRFPSGPRSGTTTLTTKASTRSTRPRD